MRPKFQPGDTVKVIKVIKNPHKEKYIGNQFIIRIVNPYEEVHNKTHYGVTDSHCPYTFFEEELEIVTPKTLTKSDLKTGLVVEYSNGEKALVVNNRLLSLAGFNLLESYDDNLICLSNPNYNIDQVYSLNANELYSLEGLLYPDTSDLIWEREDINIKPQKMTKTEIEARLGYEIEIVEG